VLYLRAEACPLLFLFFPAAGSSSLGGTMRSYLRSFGVVFSLLIVAACGEFPTESPTESVGPMIQPAAVQNEKFGGWEVRQQITVSSCGGLTASGEFNYHVNGHVKMWSDELVEIRLTGNSGRAVLTDELGNVYQFVQSEKFEQTSWGSGDFTVNTTVVLRTVSRGPLANESVVITLQFALVNGVFTLTSTFDVKCTSGS